MLFATIARGPGFVFRHHCAPHSVGPVVALCKLTAEVEIQRVDTHTQSLPLSLSLFWPCIYSNFAKKDRLYRHAAKRTPGPPSNLSTSRYFHSFKHYHKITAAAAPLIFLLLSDDTCCAFEEARGLRQSFFGKALSRSFVPISWKPTIGFQAVNGNRPKIRSLDTRKVLKSQKEKLLNIWAWCQWNDPSSFVRLPHTLIVNTSCF